MVDHPEVLIAIGNPKMRHIRTTERRHANIAK
jgi:hypothetical protein